MSAPPLAQQSQSQVGKPPARGEETSMPGALAAKLLPQTRFGGPIPWVIAILIALVVVAAAGGLSLRNLADSARADLSDAVTIQIAEADPTARARLSGEVAEVMKEQPLVTSVRIVPEEELIALIEPWLGSAAQSEEVPIPALIDVELTRSASDAEIAELQAALGAVAPEARIDAQSEWLRPVYDALSALQYLALGLIALVALATAAAVWLAARSAFSNHEDTVEILHLLGATDAQVTRIFQRSVVRDAAFGAAIGLVIGIGAIWLLSQQFSALNSGMIGSGELRAMDWIIIALVPFAGVLLALLTGRITIKLALRSML
ncbi:cell division protein FtsX [Erythrobacter rubeus]|uniref:FtsX-like permease family protein n=1 Tax=Erythrobacter rubeus TaxID=2760803 RepID=A0ABR8KQ37_9SPHN|nr:FtsX-like permease family protein [Erythrobacter rubeus]MBD2842873.1 FtsX-like permease family protein [Erythrobacter rubeus]